jgi:hypothetical protein
MKKPSPEQLESARRLLAHEMRTSLSAAAAAARMYEKVLVQLSPLVGAAGVLALFVRSLKLAQLEHPGLAGFSVPAQRAQDLAQLGNRLHDCLQEQEPGLALNAAATLFGYFFSLLAAFIGDRLTAQVLQGAWPETPLPRMRKT